MGRCHGYYNVFASNHLPPGSDIEEESTTDDHVPSIGCHIHVSDSADVSWFQSGADEWCDNKWIS